MGQTQQALAGSVVVEGVEFLLDLDESGLSKILLVGEGADLLLSQLPFVFEGLDIFFEEF